MGDMKDVQLGLGDLWRDVVNALGEEPVTPARMLLLLDGVAPRWAGAHHFMQFVAERLADPSGRAEIEAEIACATIGWRLWREQRDALWRWMRATSHRPVEAGDLDDWWLGGRWGVMAVEEQAQVVSFIKAIEWLPEERARIRVMRSTRGDKEVLVYRLRESLGWLGELERLAYCMTVLMRAAVIDFVDDLLETTRFPQARGSMRCVECGQFVGRRALGYGQLYCSDRCEKRAAKRRYRARCAA